MSANNLFGVVLTALVLFIPGQAESAATFTIINGDDPLVGFNDTTAALPVGGNPGVTLGAQRLNAFDYAANTLWGARLDSTIPIVVEANFGPLTCDATSATLGSAGPLSGFTFGGAIGPVPADTIVSLALGDKLNSMNNFGANDISASFNSEIGTTGCLEASGGWYFGFDQTPGAGQIDFVTVLLHELAHGLGFLTFVDTATGAEALVGGVPRSDIFEVFLTDIGTATAWTGMTDLERMASAINQNMVVWTGPVVTAGSTATSGEDGSGQVLVYSPSTLIGGSSISHWTQATSDCAVPGCTPLTPTDLMQPSYSGPTHVTFITHLALEDMGWGPVALPVTLQTFSIE